MPRPLGHIRILMSARVLFDLEEADAIFKEKGEAEYADYMRARGKYKDAYDPMLEGRKLAPGPLWSLASALLELNKDLKPDQEPVVELGLLCKDTLETALPIFRNLDVTGLGIEYRVFTAGGQLDMSHHEAFGTDLLLGRNPDDVQTAVDNNIAAAVINFPPGVHYERKPGHTINLWVDGDAVALGSSSEVIYQRDGLEVYRETEAKNFDQDMEAGPFTAFLAKISELNKNFSPEEPPFKISLLTARGGNSAAHIMTAAEKHGISFNGGAFFMAGASKTPPLQALAPDIFFDDQMRHLEESQMFCPTGHVAYAQEGPMGLFLKERQEITEPKKAEPVENPTPHPRASSGLAKPRMGGV